MPNDQTVSTLVSRSAAPAPGWDGLCAPAPTPPPIQELRIARGSGWPHATLSVAARPPD